MPKHLRFPRHFCISAGFPKDRSALAPHRAAAVHDEDVGRQAEHEAQVERQVLVVGPAEDAVNE